MDTVLTTLGLLTLVACSGLATRFLPRVPLPLLQIALGAALAWPDVGLHVPFDPGVFMLLFIPPLLFAEGWQIPKREFGNFRGLILVLAVGLVLATVAGLGALIHAMVPGLPLSVACVLAAVLSPTDAVAVSAIAGRHRLPPGLQHVLEGESLMNDASALVAMKFAVAATMTHSFSLPRAALDFVLMACGGVAVGVAFSWAFGLLHHRLLRWHEGHPVKPTVLLLLLMPFAPYLIAEHFGLSGILAAVAAGMTANMLDVKSSRFNASHLQTRATWDVISFAFNGLIFLLLGLQFPDILRHAPPPSHALGPPSGQHLPELFGAALLIMAALLALRFAWLACLTGLPVWLARLRGRTPAARPSLVLLGVGALGGIRGAITLAAVLSVPLTLPDGTAFPARDLLIFQAAVAIVLSLVIGSVGMPWLLRKLDGSAATAHEREERWARKRASLAAVRLLDTVPAALEPLADAAPGEADADALAAVHARVGHDYRRRLAQAAGDHRERRASHWSTHLEKTLRLQALQAERNELHRLRLRHQINDETLRTLVDELDRHEVALRGHGG
ncbi:Na+/H+ antiporter [Variovorax terrae]|uniref:Na+/H+ antiporter n=1 Tax=Variovorax terrae TaxID=2923278 RepID=A0A9X1VST2_9BURK|nr:Na+/H+ antiporter [Variovorax terrae]MCJ0762285.1 Na+/H+ antiporter [Variovorax terrae]